MVVVAVVVYDKACCARMNNPIEGAVSSRFGKTETLFNPRLQVRSIANFHIAHESALGKLLVAMP